MSNPGPKHYPISPAAIVRYGFTRAERMAIARRDLHMMAALAQNYDRAIVDEICLLCDSFAAKHGTDEERRG